MPVTTWGRRHMHPGRDMRDAPQHTQEMTGGWRRRSRRTAWPPRSWGAITVTSRTSWSAAAKKAGEGRGSLSVRLMRAIVPTRT